MKDITIPPEALEAVFKTLTPAAINHSEARAAILAALNAWPGMDTKDGSDYWVPQIIILPMETSDD